MATPGQLVQVTAGVLGIPTPTVTQYDRVLAENGLRSKSGRGPSAAQVTSRDAANLLIAVAASPLLGSQRRTRFVIANFIGSMPLVAGRSKRNFSQIGLPILDRLPKEHSFGDALSALIDFVGEQDGVGSHLRQNVSMFEVQLVGPDPSAQIVAESSTGANPLAKLLYVGAIKRRPRGAPIIFGDLRQTSSIGPSTSAPLAL